MSSQPILTLFLCMRLSMYFCLGVRRTSGTAISSDNPTLLSWHSARRASDHTSDATDVAPLHQCALYDPMLPSAALQLTIKRGGLQRQLGTIISLLIASNASSLRAGAVVRLPTNCSCLTADFVMAKASESSLYRLRRHWRPTHSALLPALQ